MINHNILSHRLKAISAPRHNMEIWGIYVVYHIGYGGIILALVVVWLRRHSSITRRKKKIVTYLGSKKCAR